MLKERCAIGLKIFERMKKGQPGDIITSSEMTAFVGMDCRNSYGDGWKKVKAELNRLERQEHVFWRWIRESDSPDSLGHWLCLDENGKSKYMGTRSKKMRSQAKRICNTGESIDYSKLDEKLHNQTIFLHFSAQMTCKVTDRKFKNLAIRENRPAKMPTDQELKSVFYRKLGHDKESA